MCIVKDIKLRINDNQPRKPVCLLQDLLRVGQFSNVSDYFALSVTRQSEGICIKITSTDPQPVTYMAIMRESEKFDFSSLQFVMQSDGI